MGGDDGSRETLRVCHCHLIESRFLRDDGIVSYLTAHCDTCIEKYCIKYLLSVTAHLKKKIKLS